MSIEFFMFLALGALSGGFINGLSGTGTALFALGFYLIVLDPIKAVAITASMSVLIGVQGLWVVRHHVLADPARLLRFIIAGLAGVPIGLMLLEIIDATLLRMVIATLLIIYGGYFSFRSSLPIFEGETPILDAIFGFVGGILGGASGISGAIPSMWLSMRPWTKFETRSILQPFNMTLLSTTVCLLFLKGAYDQTTLTAFLFTVPVGLTAAQIGISVFKRLSDRAFRRLLIFLTLFMGIGIMSSELI